MAAYSATYPVDLAAPSVVTPLPHVFAMGDNESHTFTALVYNSEDPECGLMDGSVAGVVVRPDGGTVPLIGTKGEETVDVPLPGGTVAQATPCSLTLIQGCFAYAGQIIIVIRLVNGDQMTAVFVGRGTVTPSLTDTTVDPGEVVPDITGLIAQAEQAAADAQAAVAASSNLLRYDAQTLTAAQQVQARGNISAAEAAEFDAVAYPRGVEMLTSAGEAVRLIAGGLGTSGGDTNNTARARTQYFAVQPGHRYVFTLDDAEFGINSVFEYSSTSQGTVIGRLDPVYYPKNRVAFVATGKFVRIAFAHADNTITVTEEDRAQILAALSLRETASDNLAPVDNPTAAVTHTAGSLLTVSGQLYKATQAIAPGDAIAAGTNVTATSVAEQLAALEARIAALEG